MRHHLAAALALAILGTSAACNNNQPDYNVTVTLPSTDGGVAMRERALKDGTASLKYFPCSISIRFGQCVDSRPIQAVIVPAPLTESGDTGCLPNSARRLLSSRVGDTIQLGKGADAGVVWIQAFHGDDDDDNGLVNPYEMLAYAELTRGTLVVSDITDDEIVADVDATSADGLATLKGTLGAYNSDNGVALGVGPRCTWPIGAKTE